MSNLKNFAAGLGALVAAIAGGVAHAATFDFSFSGTNGGESFSGSGMLASSSTTSPYALSAISGMATDSSYGGGAPSAITGLSGFLGADNILYYPTEPYVDYNGISFSMANGNAINLFFEPGFYIAQSTTGSFSGITLRVMQVTPLPATWTMMLVGLAGLGVMANLGRNRRSSTAAG